MGGKTIVNEAPGVSVSEEVVDGAAMGKVLKVDHTHAGVFYKKGTPIDELKAHSSSITYMRENGVI